MSRTKIIISISFLSVFLLFSFNFVSFPQGVGAAAFLRFGQDARALGMGGAFVAISDNYAAPYWNPAGVAIPSGTRLGSMYTQPYQVKDLNLALVSGKTRIEKIGVAGAFTRFYTSYTSMKEETAGQKLSYSESLYAATLAKRLRGLGLIGGTIKNYRFSAPGGGEGGQDAYANGLGFDLGLLYSIQTPSIRLGAAVFDFDNTNIKWKGTPQEPVNQVPLIYRVGAAYGLGFVDAVVAIGYDFTSRENRKKGAARNVIRFGLEYKPTNRLAMRTGGMMPEGEGISFTVGGGVSISSLRVDFAWLEKPGSLGQAAEGGVGSTIVLSAEYKL